MAAPVVVRDEWTPLLKQLAQKTGSGGMKRFYGDTAEKTVTTIQAKMLASEGFGDESLYAPLKITHRYHGSKQLVANKRNLKRRAPGAVIQHAPIGGKASHTIRVTDKTPVNKTTRPLIDTGLTLNSWDVLDYDSHGFRVGPRSPAEVLKAYYNDDRGKWEWGAKAVDQVMHMVEDYIDSWIFP